MKTKPTNSTNKHQEKICLDTIKHPDKWLLGGPNAAESEYILKTKFGYSIDKINLMKKQN